MTNQTGNLVVAFVFLMFGLHYICYTILEDLNLDSCSHMYFWVK